MTERRAQRVIRSFPRKRESKKITFATKLDARFAGMSDVDSNKDVDGRIKLGHHGMRYPTSAILTARSPRRVVSMSKLTA
jgi:hypothetical protein